MKKFTHIFIAASLALTVLLPGTLFAEPNTEITEGLPPIYVTADAPEDASGTLTIQQLVTKYIVKGANYIVVLLIGMTVLVFMYGLMKYMFKGRESDAARTEGRKLMLWGIIGIFVMISVWGLVGILSNTLGHTSNAIPQFRTTGTTGSTDEEQGDELVPPSSSGTERLTLWERFKQRREERATTNSGIPNAGGGYTIKERWDAFMNNTPAQENLYNR